MEAPNLQDVCCGLRHLLLSGCAEITVKSGLTVTVMSGLLLCISDVTVMSGLCSQGCHYDVRAVTVISGLLPCSHSCHCDVRTITM